MWRAVLIAVRRGRDMADTAASAGTAVRPHVPFHCRVCAHKRSVKTLHCELFIGR